LNELQLIFTEEKQHGSAPVDDLLQFDKQKLDENRRQVRDSIR